MIRLHHVDILPALRRGFQLLRRLEQQLSFAVHRPGNPGLKADVLAVAGRLRRSDLDGISHYVQA